MPWLVEVGLFKLVLQLICLCCGGGEVAGVLAIVPSQASLSGGCKGIVQLNLCCRQQDMPHRAGGSSLDTWECECCQTCVKPTPPVSPTPLAVCSLGV